MDFGKQISLPPGKKGGPLARRNGQSGRSKGGTSVRNPVGGHSPTIDARGQEWGDLDPDMLSYLSSIESMEQFADKANNAEELAIRVEPFLENAKRYMEGLEKIAEGQADFTELRAKFGQTVANAVLKIRSADAKFAADMQVINSKDKASRVKIEQQRDYALQQIAYDLSTSIQMQSLRHQTKMRTIGDRIENSQQQASAAEQLRQLRRASYERIRFGSQGAKGLPPEQIPVEAAQGPSQSVKGNGFFSKLWQGLSG